MSFVVSSSELQKQLSMIAGVAPTKSVLPVLQGIHFKREDSKLHLTASDLENAMQTWVQVDPMSPDAFNVVIPSKLLLDTLKALPDQPLTFSVDAGDDKNPTVRVKTDNGEYTIIGMNGLDFPQMPAPTDVEAVKIPAAVSSKPCPNACSPSPTTNSSRP